MYEGNIKAKDDERFGTCEMQASLFLFNLIIYDAEIAMFELKKSAFLFYWNKQRCL